MHEPNHKQGGQCLRVGSLFSGYGGLDLAVENVFDADTIWFSEINQPVAQVFAHHWPSAPNLGDITTIDWPSVPPVDILCGGFPCQDVSTVGKMAGLAPGTRSGLWAHMATAIEHLQPEYVVIENVRGLLSAPAIRPAPQGDDDDRRNPEDATGTATGADATPGDVESNPWHLGDEPARPLRAAGAVLGDLVDLRYDAQWNGLPASAIGAPHPRFRVFIVAHRTVPHTPRLRRRAGWESLQQVKARRGTIALSHQIIDLALHGPDGYPRARESESLWVLIGELFDAGDAMPMPSADGNTSPDDQPPPLRS